jgi:hypothetical protein
VTSLACPTPALPVPPSVSCPRALVMTLTRTRCRGLAGFLANAVEPRPPLSVRWMIAVRNSRPKINSLRVTSSNGAITFRSVGRCRLLADVLLMEGGLS